MGSSLEIPSVSSIRSALRDIPGAMRDDEPLPEHVAIGSDPAIEISNPDDLPVAQFEGFSVDVEVEDQAFTDDPLVLFEVPPEVTDADLRNALGKERLKELHRLEQIHGLDALGWYVTFHQRAYQYGVHIPFDGVVYLAIQAFAGLPLPPERKLELAFHAIARHELFHFSADCMSANWELAAGVSTFWPAAMELRNANGYDELEEGLANAYMLRGFRHPSQVLSNSGGAYGALKAFCRRQPIGYSDGPEYARSRGIYLDHCRQLSRDHHKASKPSWHAPDALDPLIFYPGLVRVDWTRCPIIVHDRDDLLATLGIGISAFRTILQIRETSAFTRSLGKLDKRLQKQWQIRKADLKRSTALKSLDFKRWKPGGPNCYSVRVDSNFRAHLRYDPAEAFWAAEEIGNHKAMGHG